MTMMSTAFSSSFRIKDDGDEDSFYAYFAVCDDFNDDGCDVEWIVCGIFELLITYYKGELDNLQGLFLVLHPLCSSLFYLLCFDVMS